MIIWAKPFIRRFWSYLTFKHSVFICFCIWSMNVQLNYRVPGKFLFVLLPWISAALSIVGFTLLVNQLFISVPKTHPIKQTFRRIERWASVVLLVFIFYSLVLYANGSLDRSGISDHPYEVVKIAFKETDLGGRVFYSWAKLRSQENPGKTKHFLLKGKERKALWAGEAVIVQVREGFLGIPWVSRIDRNEEKYSKEILQAIPTASSAWKDLIRFYIEHRRWEEAGKATQNYLEIYPDDYEFALHVGSGLNVVWQLNDGIPLLKYVADRQPTYKTYVLMGWGFHRQGDNQKAAQSLRKAIRIEPNDWEAYYHLGGVYQKMEKHEESIEMFEKVLEFQPGFPKVKTQLINLREKIAEENDQKNNSTTP